jgi:DNA-binding CsgD family transcriptional regulator
MTDAETARIEDLVRFVVELDFGSAGNTPDQRDPNAEEIVFDVEVEGSRYLLVRLPRPAPPDVQLSPREREIVRLVARGHSNKIIADVLNISSWTVCTHMRRIFAKLGVGSRAAMVARMPEIGLTGPPPGAVREPSSRGRNSDGAQSRTPVLPDVSVADRSR